MAGQVMVAGKHWGNFASAELMPNCPQYVLSTTTHPPIGLLQPGDLAFLTTQGATYQCAAVGTSGGGNATWTSLLFGNTTTAASIAGLRALNGGYVAVLVDSYAAANDGGGGWFVWNGTQPIANDNGGTIIAPTGANIGCWMRQAALGTRTWNARWFGARGDGATNDAPAINALFVALGRLQTSVPEGTYLGGGIGYLPQGVYRCTSTVNMTPLVYANISFHMSLIGDGELVSVLEFTSGGVLATDYPGGNVSSQAHVRDVGIWNLNANSQSSGLYYQGAGDCVVERVIVSGWREGITWLDCDQMYCRNVLFYANPQGVPASAGSIGIAFRGETNQVVVEQCQFNGPGINVLQAGGVVHRISNCNSEGGILARIQDTGDCVHEGWSQEGQDATNAAALFEFDDQGSGVNVLVADSIVIRDSFFGGSLTRPLVLFDPQAIVRDFEWSHNSVAACPATGVVTLPSSTHIGGSCLSSGPGAATNAPLFSSPPPQWLDQNIGPSTGYYVTGSQGSPQLPATAQAGTLVFAVNGRKTGEAHAQGTGVPVYFSAGSWRVLSTDQPVAW